MYEGRRDGGGERRTEEERGEGEERGGVERRTGEDGTRCSTYY